MRAQSSNFWLACSHLIEVLQTVGPEEVVDMDGALCRESLDVIGETPYQPAGLTKLLPTMACQSRCMELGVPMSLVR